MSHPNLALESSCLLNGASKDRWLLSVEARLPYQISDTAVSFITESHSIAKQKGHEQPDPYAPELSWTEEIKATTKVDDYSANYDLTEVLTAFIVNAAKDIVVNPILQLVAVGKRNHSLLSSVVVTEN